MPLQEVPATSTVPTYSANHSPALEVAEGEVFRMVTADRFAGAENGVVPARERAGALVGPVRVHGARRGDVLAIEIVSIRPCASHAYVLASPKFGLLGDRIRPRATRVELESDRIHYPPGASLPLRPMVGKIGLAPAGPGAPGVASGDFGGALSNTRIAPGATLMLAVQCEGGLLCIEDVHAYMGDGEATASAIEMPAEVTLRCTVDRSGRFSPPMILTEEEAITLGEADTLDGAAERATEAMLELIQRERDVDLTEAAMIVGAVVDVHVAFIGATPKKAYAVIPRAVLESARR